MHSLGKTLKADRFSHQRAILVLDVFFVLMCAATDILFQAIRSAQRVVQNKNTIFFKPVNTFAVISVIHVQLHQRVMETENNTFVDRPSHSLLMPHERNVVGNHATGHKAGHIGISQKSKNGCKNGRILSHSIRFEKCKSNMKAHKHERT